MEKVPLQIRSMRDGMIKNKVSFKKDALIFEEKIELNVEQATAYFKRILGVVPTGTCKCKPLPKHTPSDDYFTFPENSPYGLNDCKEVVLGGANTVDADSVKAGLLKLKPKVETALVMEKPKTAAKIEKTSE